jgi:acetyl-CoA decarbonylase/synthase complex subunit delta
MEAVGAVSYLMAGSDILIMRHPESIRMVKAFIDLVSEGGSANDVAPAKKELDDVDIDYAALAPEPDLTIEEEAKKAAPAKKKAPPAKKAAPKEKPAPAKIADQDVWRAHQPLYQLLWPSAHRHHHSLLPGAADKRRRIRR